MVINLKSQCMFREAVKYYLAVMQLQVGYGWVTGWLRDGFGWLRDGYAIVMGWLRSGYEVFPEQLRGGYLWLRGIYGMVML